MGGVHISFLIDYLPANMERGWGLVHSTVYYKCKNKRSPPSCSRRCDMQGSLTQWICKEIEAWALLAPPWCLSGSHSLNHRLIQPKGAVTANENAFRNNYACLLSPRCPVSATRSAHLQTRTQLHFLDSRLAICRKYVWLLLTPSSGCSCMSFCCFTWSYLHVSPKIFSSAGAIFTSVCCDKFKEHSEGPCALHTLLGSYENMIYRFKCGTYWQR